MAEMIVTYKGRSYIPLADFAKEHGLEQKPLRRWARKSAKANSAEVRKYGQGWIIDTNAKPVLTQGAHRPTRADGRSKFTIWATEAEVGSIEGIVGKGNVVNPRTLAKAKRAARKATKQAEK